MKAFARVLAIAVMATTITPPRAASAFQLKAGRVISAANNLSISYVESKGDEEHNCDAPTTIFIHGLDSSSQTWRGVQQSLATPSIAIDCRGCGRSDLGDPDDFSPAALAEDVHCLISNYNKNNNNKPFVVVGHSMGGRVAMEYAARHPENVAALVVEDMDVRRRGVESNFVPNFDEEKAVAFERGHDTLESVKRELEGIGYAADMYSKWIDEGRIYREDDDDGKFWSDVNPAFRALCYRRIFDTNSGTDSWNAITANLQQQQNKDGGNKDNANTKTKTNDAKNDDDDAKVHLMVAGIGTVCDESSIDDMRKAMPGGLSVTRYARGTHSIHNSAREEFMAELGRIIDGAAKQQCVAEGKSRL